MNPLLRSLGLSTGLLAALALLPGCPDEKKQPEVEVDAGAEPGPQKPVLNGKLAAAVKAAESAQASSPSKSGEDGPPDNGVFGPGMADKAFAPGAPAKVDVVAAGGQPRFTLSMAPTDEQKETVSVTLRQAGNAIQVEYAIAFKIDKPKDDKPKDDKDKDKDKDKKAEGPRTYRVVGKVTGVQLPSQLSRDASDKLGKLKGTEIRYTLGPSGMTDLGYTLVKDADPALGDAVVKALIDALNLSMPPLPSTPVGAGGYWMVTDRTSTFGVDVVRYRVYKVEKIDKDQATFSLDVRQYATKDEVDLGQKMSLQHFESQGKGKLEWTAANLLPGKGDTTVRTSVLGTVPSGQQGMFQADVSAKLTAQAPDKKK